MKSVMDRINKISKINKIQSEERECFPVFDLILYIPFPRVRGKVGWGRPEQGM